MQSRLIFFYNQSVYWFYTSHLTSHSHSTLYTHYTTIRAIKICLEKNNYIIYNIYKIIEELLKNTQLK